MLRGEPVHGEAIIDGDASGGIAVVLYVAGTTTVRALGADEYLHVTHLLIGTETGGETWLVADSKAAGRYVCYAVLAAKARERSYFGDRPYTCPKGTGLKFYGAATDLNSCILEGFITGA